MNPAEAKRLYQYFVERVKDGYVGERVKDGKFQAMMEVALVNDGPVSLRISPGEALVGSKLLTAAARLRWSLKPGRERLQKKRNGVMGRAGAENQACRGRVAVVACCLAHGTATPYLDKTDEPGC